MVLNLTEQKNHFGAFNKHLCPSPTSNDSDDLLQGGIQALIFFFLIFPNDSKM